eukprot:XP_001691755.1 predicted protein [Chlamydomonas reinhardtii]
MVVSAVGLDVDARTFSSGGMPDTTTNTNTNTTTNTSTTGGGGGGASSQLALHVHAARPGGGGGAAATASGAAAGAGRWVCAGYLAELHRLAQFLGYGLFADPFHTEFLARVAGHLAAVATAPCLHDGVLALLDALPDVLAFRLSLTAQPMLVATSLNAAAAAAAAAAGIGTGTASNGPSVAFVRRRGEVAAAGAGHGSSLAGFVGAARGMASGGVGFVDEANGGTGTPRHTSRVTTPSRSNGPLRMLGAGGGGGGSMGAGSLGVMEAEGGAMASGSGAFPTAGVMPINGPQSLVRAVRLPLGGTLLNHTLCKAPSPTHITAPPGGSTLPPRSLLTSGGSGGFAAPNKNCLTYLAMDPSIARDLADPTEAPDMRQQQLQLQQPQPQQAPSASAAPPPRQRRARPTVVALADASSHVLDEQHTQRDVILAGGQLGPGSSAGTLLVCVEGALPPGAPPAMVLVPSGTTGDLACGGTGAGCGQIMWSHSNICDTITSQAFLSAATATATPKGSLELPEPGSSRWQPRTGVGITSGEGGVAAAAAAAAAASGTMGGSAPNVAMACDRTVGSILSEAGGGASSRAAGGVARLMTSVLGSGPGQGLAAVPALLAPAPVQLAMYLVFPEVLSWASIDAVHIELQSLMPLMFVSLRCAMTEAERGGDGAVAADWLQLYDQLTGGRAAAATAPIMLTVPARRGSSGPGGGSSHVASSGGYRGLGAANLSSGLGGGDGSSGVGDSDPRRGAMRAELLAKKQSGSAALAALQRRAGQGAAAAAAGAGASGSRRRESMASALGLASPTSAAAAAVAAAAGVGGGGGAAVSGGATDAVLPPLSPGVDTAMDAAIEAAAKDMSSNMSGAGPGRLLALSALARQTGVGLAQPLMSTGHSFLMNTAPSLVLEDPSSLAAEAAASTEQLVTTMRARLLPALSAHQEFTPEGANKMAFTQDLASVELVEILGHGGQGVVFHGTMHGLEVAVKVLEQKKPPPKPQRSQPPPTPSQLARGASLDDGDSTARGGQNGAGSGAGVGSGNGEGDEDAVIDRVDEEQIRTTKRSAMEMAVASLLGGHPHIVQVYAVFSNVAVIRHKDARGAAAKQLRLCTVDDPILGGITPDPINQVLCLEVALALRHLHSKRLVHCDVKAANVLLKSSVRDRRGWSCKLSDFGCVRLMNEEGPDGQSGFRMAHPHGTVAFMAPECFIGARVLQTSAVDVYAFGIMMYELMMLRTPYKEMDQRDVPHAVVRRRLRPDFHPMAPPAYCNLAARCWTADPRQRPTATQLVSELQFLLNEATQLQGSYTAAP